MTKSRFYQGRFQPLDYSSLLGFIQAAGSPAQLSGPALIPVFFGSISFCAEMLSLHSNTFFLKFPDFWYIVLCNVNFSLSGLFLPLFFSALIEVHESDLFLTLNCVFILTLRPYLLLFSGLDLQNLNAKADRLRKVK